MAAPPSSPLADLDLEFLPILFGVLIGGLLLVGVVRMVLRWLARGRYSLGEFWALILLVGLGMGLTAKACPAQLGLAFVMPLAVLVGLLLLWGGTLGLFAAHWLNEARPARRLLLLVRGVLVAPAVASLLILPLFILSVEYCGLGARLGVGAGIVLGLGLLVAHLVTFGRLLQRARLSRARARTAEFWAKADLPPELRERLGLPPLPPASPHLAGPASDPSDQSDQSDGSDGSDRADEAEPPPR